MFLIQRATTPADEPRIIDLMKESFGLAGTSAELDSRFLHWKYWAPHPLFGNSRSHVVEKEGALLAHGCIWPIHLLTSLGEMSCFHLVDWAARQDAPGAGMRILREFCGGFSASFSIGGSSMTRKILPAVGFRSYNPISFLTQPMPPYGRRPPKRTPVSFMRSNLGRLFSPEVGLPAGWDIEIREPEQIPAFLWPDWPDASPGLAVSLRSPALLAHIAKCPEIKKSLCCVLSRRSEPIAYLYTVQIGEQLRLADYGPAGLDEETSVIVGRAFQEISRNSFSHVTELMAVTSETGVLAGLLQTGFQLRGETPITVLTKNPDLQQVDRFRLTLLDWDLLSRAYVPSVRPPREPLT